MSEELDNVAERFYCVYTDAKCTDADLGALLPRYLVSTLAPAQADAFLLHVEDCEACGASVSNWLNLIGAIRYYGIDPVTVGEASSDSKKAS